MLLLPFLESDHSLYLTEDHNRRRHQKKVIYLLLVERDSRIIILGLQSEGLSQQQRMGSSCSPLALIFSF